jgi:two-component sensor histidine kinase
MRTAVRIALIYFVFAILWITVSDRILGHFVTSTATITQFQTYKGLAFIGLNTLLLFFLIRSHIRALEIRVATEMQLVQMHRDLLRELDHRVRNNLAELGSLLTIYRRSSASVPDLSDRFQRRINGFKIAHELIAANGFARVPVEEVIRKALAGHGQAEVDFKSHPDQVFGIDPLQVSPLVAALQEVAEHAGVCAQGTPSGVIISVDWSIVPATGEQASFGHVSTASIMVVVQGPGQEAHGSFFNSRDSGSGRSLVEGLVRFNLGGEVQVTLSGPDLICRIDVPAEALRTMNHPVMDVRNTVRGGVTPATMLGMETPQRGLER